MIELENKNDDGMGSLGFRGFLCYDSSGPMDLTLVYFSNTYGCISMAPSPSTCVASVAVTNHYGSTFDLCSLDRCH